MKLASADFMNQKAGTNYILKVREESNRWLLKHIYSMPTAKQIEDANAFVKKNSGLALYDEDLSRILDLFPVVRIELAVHGIENIETQDNLMDAISNFFLGCTWPRLGDNVDVKRFISLLINQAKSMGYSGLEAVGQKHQSPV